MNKATAKILMMKWSFRCFVDGLLSFIPVIGMGFALAALWFSWQARRQEKQFWNAARPYRTIGTTCAIIGPVFWFLILALVIYNAENNGGHGGIYYMSGDD
jgi:hypothetical protein